MAIVERRKIHGGCIFHPDDLKTLFTGTDFTEAVKLLHMEVRVSASGVADTAVVSCLQKKGPGGVQKDGTLLPPWKDQHHFPQGCLFIKSQIKERQSGLCPGHETQLSTLSRALKGGRRCEAALSNRSSALMVRVLSGYWVDGSLLWAI